MGRFIRTQLWPAIAILLAFAVITGFIYPVVVTAAAQAVFPNQSNGSMIAADGQTLGSSLIGQTFDQPKDFWGRPSAAGARGYDPALPGGPHPSSHSPALMPAP